MSYKNSSGKKLYRYILSTQRDPATGKYRQIWRSGFTTKAAADEAMRKHITELEGRLDSHISLADFLEIWLQQCRSRLSPMSIETYEYTCYYYIIPFLGDIKLSSLEPRHIERLYAHWQKSLSASSVHRIHRILRTALNRALKMGYIHVSPMQRVDSPSNRINKRNILSVKQALTVLQWLKERSDVVYQASYLALYTGMRRSEIAGLQWQDIDWQENIIRVKRTRQRKRNQDMIGHTKTQDSLRPIFVSSNVLVELNTWYQKHQHHTSLRGETWSEKNYVVRHWDGDIPHPATFSVMFHNAIVALGLPKVSFHDLRHTHATWMLESGVDLKIVSDRLGHRNISTTANTYAHVTKRMHKNAVDKFSRLIGDEN